MSAQSLRSACLAALLFAAGSGSAAAQEMVPLEFVQSLSFLNPMGGGQPEVMIGRVPERSSWLPIPGNARVIGSLASDEYSVISLAVPEPPAMATEYFAELLADVGLDAYNPDSREGGFQSNTGYRGVLFCAPDSASVSASVRRNPNGGSFLVVMHQRDARRSPCGHRQPPGVVHMRLLIPNLNPPTGARAYGSGTSYGDQRQESEGQLTTTLSAEDVARHYHDQLVAAGWTPLSDIGTPELAARTYRVTLTGEGAGEWHGLLLASKAPGSDEVFLTARMARPDRR